MSTQSPSPSRVPAIVTAAVLANLAGSVAGGRVLSAGQGLAGLTVMGSGSLMALLLGTVVSVGVLRLARLAKGGGGLTWVAACSLACSAGLYRIYLAGLARSGTGFAAGGQLGGGLAWAFFLVLVLRCAMWFAGRSLRTGLVSAADRAWLGWSEGAYFGGLVIGLVMGLPAWLGGDRVLSALALDLALLTLGGAADMVLVAGFARLPAAAANRAGAGRLRAVTVAQLTLAFAATTIGCQIVVFQLADWLARPTGLALREWADFSLAAFYVGVAVTAASSFRLKPRLSARGGRRTVVTYAWLSGDRHIALVWLQSLTAAILMTGVLSLAYLARVSPASGRGAAWWAALAAIAVGAGVFEVLVLAVLDGLARGGPGAVATGIAVAASLATAAMFLMLLAGADVAVWLAVNVAGLATAGLLAPATTAREAGS